MDDEMKKLLRALSDAVNESLINSSAFVDAVAAVWRAGRDESPSVDAPLADADESAEVSADTTDPPAMLTLTADGETSCSLAVRGKCQHRGRIGCVCAHLRRFVSISQGCIHGRGLITSGPPHCRDRINERARVN